NTAPTSNHYDPSRMEPGYPWPEFLSEDSITYKPATAIFAREKELVSPPSRIEAKLSHSSTPDSKSNSQNQADSNSGFSLPKIYDPSVEEPRWQDFCRRHDLYKFDSVDSSKPSYRIETLTPYPR